jgi:glycosyltransferase involved in cell wall biosynthesis
MKVLALASYPVEAAATRFRLNQFVEPLAARGITMTIRPFLDSRTFKHLYQQRTFLRTAAGICRSSFSRLVDAFSAKDIDALVVQREAMIFGPPLIEWLAARVKEIPMVLDLDDATYVSYTSPTYGGISRSLKWFGKTDTLIKWATFVICGNGSIAEYVSSKGGHPRVIPTVVDTDVFRPAPQRTNGSETVLGWIGTHSTYPYLESIFPVLSDLAKQYELRLRIVGAGRSEVTLPDLPVDNLSWKLEREVADFQSIDIGLYPIDESVYSGWAAGKSGFKAIQYMAVGVPYVATPLGGSNEIGAAGITHLFARTPTEWYRALEELIQNREYRRAMGAAGREHVIKHYRLDDQANKLADVLREASR